MQAHSSCGISGSRTFRRTALASAVALASSGTANCGRNRIADSGVVRRRVHRDGSTPSRAARRRPARHLGPRRRVPGRRQSDGLPGTEPLHAWTGRKLDGQLHRLAAGQGHIHVRLRRWRRPVGQRLQERLLPGPQRTRRDEPLRHRPRRGRARAAGFSRRPQLHRRGDQHDHAAPGDRRTLLRRGGGGRPVRARGIRRGW